MRKPGRFGKNIISNASGNAIHAVLQLALIFVLFRILDDSRYAAFITATYLIGLLEMASDYGGRLWATREFAVSDSPRCVLQHSVLAKLFYTIVSAGVMALVPLNTLTLPGFVLCVLVAATQPSSDPFLWFLRSRERLDIEAIVVLCFRVAIVTGILFVCVAGYGLPAMLIIWLTCNIARMVIELRLNVSRPLRTGDGALTDPSYSTAATIRAVFPVGTALVLTCLFQRTSLYLMESFASVHEYKIYATAFKLVNTSGFIATGVFVSSFAPLAKAIQSSDANAIRSVIRRKLILVTAVFLPVCILGVLLSVPIAGMVPLPGFTSVARVMVLLMPGLYLSCINMGLKYTLNAYALNWQDVGAVVVGIAALCAATVFHGNVSWWTAGAVGWIAGEGTLLAVRIGLLWKQKKHAGVPVGVIFGSAAALMLMVVVSR